MQTDVKLPLLQLICHTLSLETQIVKKMFFKKKSNKLLVESWESCFILVSPTNAHMHKFSYIENRNSLNPYQQFQMKWYVHHIF